MYTIVPTVSGDNPVNSLDEGGESSVECKTINLIPLDAYKIRYFNGRNGV
jgi:hypothetical protein